MQCRKLLMLPTSYTTTLQKFNLIIGYRIKNWKLECAKAIQKKLFKKHNEKKVFSNTHIKVLCIFLGK